MSEAQCAYSDHECQSVRDALARVADLCRNELPVQTVLVGEIREALSGEVACRVCRESRCSGLCEADEGRAAL